MRKNPQALRRANRLPQEVASVLTQRHQPCAARQPAAADQTFRTTTFPSVATSVSTCGARFVCHGSKACKTMGFWNAHELIHESYGSPHVTNTRTVTHLIKPGVPGDPCANIALNKTPYIKKEKTLPGNGKSCENSAKVSLSSSGKLKKGSLPMP